MFYMTNRCGAWQVGNSDQTGKIEFRMFFPKGVDPRVASIRVAFTLESPELDFTKGVDLKSRTTADGTFWEALTPSQVPPGFYEYKYLVTFQDGETRQVSDPCARYSGTKYDNSAVVIGGSQPADNVVPAISGGRKPYSDLVIYELMIDDFTAGYRRERAPLEAVVDKLDYLAGLGFNAILFMPWTAWDNTEFDWGYAPCHYFALESRYADSLNFPNERLSWLKKLVAECHSRGLHVIMDGVYNHAGMNFPYRQFYKDPDSCPYTGKFGGEFPGLKDLNFNNDCTNEFIQDACFYWMDIFGIDGIRLDNTVNYYVPGDPHGLPELLDAIDGHVSGKGESNFSLTLEHLQLDAVDLTKKTKATSYWDNGLYEKCFDGLWWSSLPPGVLNALNNNRWLNTPGKVPTIYLSNHDHSHVTWQAGARDNQGCMDWFETQPWVIALFTATGTPMVQNGQEFGEDYHIMEQDLNTGRRVIPRPLRWKCAGDSIGQALQWLYQRMASIRNSYPGLRSPNIYPGSWDESKTQLENGLGIDTSQQLMIYHRWGNGSDGNLQRFVIALNFSGNDQWPAIPFPADGNWTDLLSGNNPKETFNVQGGRLNVRVPSHWGRVLFM